jgi:hypothetical protein
VSDGGRENSHDQVIVQLFESGLGLAAVLSQDGLDAETTRRLHEVLDQFDTAIHELRRIVFMPSGTLSDARSTGDTETPQPA